MTVNEALDNWRKLINRLQTQVAPVYSTEARELDQACQDYADARVREALGDTLGLLEALAKTYGDIRVRLNDDDMAYLVVFVEDAALFYRLRNEDGMKLVSRAEADALLHEEEASA